MENINLPGPEHSDSPEQRESRARKLINVEIQSADGHKYSAIVTNLSRHGMGGKTQAMLKALEQITVTKQGYGQLEGEIRWVDGQYFGVYFAEPIDVERFNFSGDNQQGHFVQQAKNGHVWTGFKTGSSTRRPGVTSRFSRS